MGVSQPEKSDPDEKVAKYPNGGRAPTVTYRKGKAVNIVKKEQLGNQLFASGNPRTIRVRLAAESVAQLWYMLALRGHSLAPHYDDSDDDYKQNCSDNADCCWTHKALS